MRLTTTGLVVLLLSLPLLLAACDDDPDFDPSMVMDAGTGDEYVAPSALLDWEKVEPAGTVCGNGSQYKFFISRSIGGSNSDNLLIYMEPGGACWDYPSCAGEQGIRGAANPDGIPDDHMTGGSVPWALASPLLRRNSSENPAWDWTLVFIPYCTGDVHTGNRTIVYEDPDSSATLEWHHNGRANSQAAIDWLDTEFSSVPKMLLTGCSAGGAGTISNYYFFRKGITGVEHGYMLDDSGPIFPAGMESDWSWPLHQKIKESWGIDTLLANEFPEYDFSDFGNINDLLSQEFPNDRMAIAHFQMDYNYSLYSYERFNFDTAPRDTLVPGTPEYRAEIYKMWSEDTNALRDRLDGLDNLGYYFPYYRQFNDSHCLTPLTWNGTEIEEEGITLQDYTEHLLDDDQPLESHFEESCEDPCRYDDDDLINLTPKCADADVATLCEGLGGL